MGQSVQTVHMLTKPHVFYDNNLKQALGNQCNSITDFEKTLMLEEESRSKMLLKQTDPMVLEKKAPRELPKVSLVNTSLKKLKYHLGQFDNVVKNRITPDALTEGEWGFEHTKAVFLKEIIPFVKTLKDIFNAFDKVLLTKITEVQIVYNQMEAVVQQYHVDKQFFEIQKKQFLIGNDRLLDQIISQDIVNIVVNSSLDENNSVNVKSFVTMTDSMNYVEMYNKCLELEAELIKQHNMNNTSVNQTEPSFDQLFELNNLNAELQAKDTTIKKLKANIKRLNKTSTTNNVKKDIDEIETINIELEHRVTKLIAENEHLKQTYKQIYDSIKPSRVQAKEHDESLERVLVITSLKNDLKKFKGKYIVDNAAQVLNDTTIAPRMYKLDRVTLASKDKNNMETHIYYLKHTMEQAVILREIVEQSKALNPLDSASYSTCKYVKLIQEFLGYVRDTCPDIHKPSEKLVVVTPINKKKIVRSKSTDNTKNDRILQISSSTQKKNKVEDHSRIVKSSLNKSNCIVEPSGNANLQHSKLNTNSELMCIKCNSSMFDARHELCFLEFVSNMNASSKSMFVKKAKKKEEWKPTGKVFTKIGYNWRPTGRTFTLVGNACPLTRITTTNKVSLREPITIEVVAHESVVTKVYTRRPKVPKTNGFNTKPKIAKSMFSNKMKPGTSRGSNTSVAPSSSSVDLRLSKLFCGIWTPDAPST
ncbi:hypothetical protein Tco_0494137 [Tanacetum coccineum]